MTALNENTPDKFRYGLNIWSGLKLSKTFSTFTAIWPLSCCARHHTRQLHKLLSYSQLSSTRLCLPLRASAMSKQPPIHPPPSSTHPSPTPPTTHPLSASDLYLSLDDPTHNPVEEAGPNHFERPSTTLTPLEQFYVDVAHSFAQEEIARRTTTNHTQPALGGAGVGVGEEERREQEELRSVGQYIGRTRATLTHFASMLDKLLARRTLNVAFAQPDDSQSDDKPTDAAFLLSRRNRLAVLIQSHSTTLSTAADSLVQQRTTLSQVLALTHRYTRDLAHLSLHWLMRVRPAVVSTLVPPVVVDVSWMSGQEAAGRVRLDRDAKGRVEVAEEVGRRSEGEDEQWRRTRRRREQRRQQQHMTAEQKQNEEEMQWENDETTPPTAASHSANPPPPPTSSSLLGWPRTASRLHRHQRHLLQLELYNTLIAEAKGWQSPHLSSVSVLSHTIHCHSPAFPSLSISFEDGPQHPFTLLVGSSRSAAADSHALYLSLLSQLTRYFIHFASSNRPMAGTIAADDPPPPLPPLLHHLITTTYHTYLTTTLRNALHTAITQHSTAIDCTETIECGAVCVNVMRFVLKRGGGLLLDAVVDGVSMYGVVRRGKRLGVLGGEDAGGVGDSAVSALDVELVRCVSVQEMVQLIHFALQPTYTA